MSLRTFHQVVLRVAVCACVLATIVFCRGDALMLADQLFNGDMLQRIDLVVDGRDWDTLKANFRENDYYRATVRWRGLTVHNAGIRSRGLGSRNGTKPGMRIDFGRFSTNQTFLGLRSFILDNLAQDASGVAEHVAMRFYERLGLVVPREAHAQLFVNGEYAGLYAVVESVDEDFVRRVFGEYGYLFEYEYTSEWFLTDPGRDLNKYRPLFDPVTHRRSAIDALYAPLDGMLRAINESPDDRFQSAVSRYLDLPLFMRHVAAQSFLAQWDGILGYAGVNNFYLYRFESSSRWQFILWDEDNAFHALDYPVLEGYERNVLMRRAMGMPELRAVYIESLLAAAASATERATPGGTGWLEREIQRQRRLIADALRSDVVKPFTNEQVETAEDALLNFARRRSEFVLCQAAGLTNPAAEPGACVR